VTQAKKADKSQAPAAPVAPRRPHSFTTHGINVTDDYAWLKDARWQEVLRDPSILDADIRHYLEAENGLRRKPARPYRFPAKEAGRGDARADQGGRFQRPRP